MTERAGRDGYAKFSPDGDYLAWHSVIDEEFSVIRLLNLDSGEMSAFSCRDWSSIDREIPASIRPFVRLFTPGKRSLNSAGALV